jgi:photosystem II stability/assembly factor-like uncharacterized protein
VTGARCPRLHWTRSGHACRSVLPLVLLLTLSGGPVQSHDPSAWGGLFRSRDDGATWVSANRGPFLSGAIALAISPTDANHLLLAAESGLFRSRNGGRDWTIEAPTLLFGSTFALAFAADGQRALVSTGRAIFRGEAENSWQEAPAPQGAAPARAIVRGSEPGRVYLAGWNGLYRSNDWGASWSNAADGLPPEPVTTLLVVQGTPEILYAVVQRGIWISVDGARNWVRRGADISSAGINALTVDLRGPACLWAAVGARLFTSNDGGASWQRAGQPLSQPNATVHAIAASEEAIVATTDGGLYRSVDGGEHWTLITDNLPAHLEAGPLMRDPVDPASLYAGFALIPYSELWRRAANHEAALVRISVTSLIGGVVFLFLVAIGAISLLRWFGQYYRPPTMRARSTRGLGGRPIKEETQP